MIWIIRCMRYLELLALKKITKNYLHLIKDNNILELALIRVGSHSKLFKK